MRFLIEKLIEKYKIFRIKKLIKKDSYIESMELRNLIFSLKNRETKEFKEIYGIQPVTKEFKEAYGIQPVSDKNKEKREGIRNSIHFFCRK